MAAAVQYHEHSGHSRLANDARRRLANLKGYEDDSRKQEAALWLGNSLLQENPDMAAAYLWNAMTWWYNSGNGGDLGSRVTKALDEMRNTRGRGQARDLRAARRVAQDAPPVNTRPTALSTGSWSNPIPRVSVIDSSFCPETKERDVNNFPVSRWLGNSSIVPFGENLVENDLHALLKARGILPAGFVDLVKDAYFHLQSGGRLGLGHVVLDGL